MMYLKCNINTDICQKLNTCCLSKRFLDLFGHINFIRTHNQYDKYLNSIEDFVKAIIANVATMGYQLPTPENLAVIN
jgi:hypothetical protein